MEAYIVLREEEYPTLLNELQKQLPASLMAYYPLMLSQKSLLPKFKFIFVDEWPEFNCVLEVENLPEDLSPHRMYGYCRREEFCVHLNRMICQRLQKSSSSINLFGGPRRMKELLSDDADTHSASKISALGSCGSKRVQDTKPSWVGGFDAFRVSKNTLKKIEVPRTFTVTTIKREYMDLVLSQWQYTGSYSDAKEFFTLTATSLESVCILNDSGEPVAWGFEQHYGAIGLINVLPDYRRKKLGSAVVSLLSEKILQKHDFVYAAIEAENAKSIILHKKVGYEKIDVYPECIFTWCYYENGKEKADESLQ
ncbi:glycine N-acyltransferase-like protein Keg1 [Saccostrea echinata]|uniref:glycine N-acyltransferase-like protein Keg1 n=1 Tax=Saccostrea echinata TaxID=191078 RepID=UPI002A803DBA|nr:glycine N-acyltransferase-like protein Keg1 [Saccostrea echinata]